MEMKVMQLLAEKLGKTKMQALLLATLQSNNKTMLIENLKQLDGLQEDVDVVATNLVGLVEKNPSFLIL